MKQKKSLAPYLVALLGAVAVMALFWLSRGGGMAPVVPGRPAPEFDAYTLDGTPRTLDDYEGKVILLNIWATWCAPCQQEMPSMQRLREAVPDQDFVILAVSIDAPQGERDSFGREGGNLEIFSREMGLTFQILHDPTGKIQDIYQATGVPESFVVDREGLIFKKVAGATEWDAPANIQLIQRLLDG